VSNVLDATCLSLSINQSINHILTWPN